MIFRFFSFFKAGICVLVLLLSVGFCTGTSIHWLMNAAAFFFESYLEEWYLREKRKETSLKWQRGCRAQTKMVCKSDHKLCYLSQNEMLRCRFLGYLC